MRHHHHRQQPTPPHRHHRQTQTDQVLSGGNTIPDSKSKSIQNPTRWNYKVSQKSTFLKAKRPQCMIVSSMSLTQQIYNHTGCIRHYQHHQQHWHHHHPRRFAVKKYSYTSIITLCGNLLSSQLSSSSSPSSSSGYIYTGPPGHILQFKIVGSGYFLISVLVPAWFLSGRFSMWIWKKVDLKKNYKD